jgi:outer membrane receptor protein involved in Fe transport
MGNAALPLRNPAGANQTVLTYRNLGRAKVNGFDAGLRFLLTDRLAVSGTASVIKADTIEIPVAPWLSAASRRELSVLNAPTTKWTAGIDGTDIVPGLLGGLTMRHVNEYAFASGVNLGVIPSFSTVDLNLGYRLPFAAQTQLNLQVTNLFSCRNTVTTQPAVPASGTTPATPANPLQVIEREGKCGFGEKHTEMINMPEVGTMVFLGVRYQR